VERDVKEGAKKPLRQRTRLRVIQELPLFLIVLTIVFISPSNYAETTYRDIKSGRQLTKRVTWYYFEKSNIKETEYSRLYRKYVSDNYPPPAWLYEYNHVARPFYKERGDNWNAEAFRNIESFTQYSVSDIEFADPKAWRAFLTTFTSIFELPIEKPEMRALSKRYFEEVENRYWDQNKQLRVSDLPNLEEIRRDVEKGGGS
jgi:hypothetical protein